MNQLYIWRNTLGRKQKGVPQNADTWLSDQKSTKDLNNTPIKGEWISYNPHKDFYPLEERLKLPKELYLYIRIKNTPVFDWYFMHHHVMAVSEKFLFFLKENKLDNHFEIAELKIINKENKEFNEKKYFAIRIIKFDDSLFNLNEEIRKRAAGIKGRFIYPQMKLKKDSESQNIFFLLEFCYNESLVLTEKVKNYILSNFHSPEIYKIEDYPLVFNNSNNLEKLPDNILL
ncbi:immunity 43 family protein [Tenacibaculum finnmarkense genomovar ulcerans]|uniref:Imm43 family immunity protein n=1 Tax=Tenacibaculum finnmarkense TaxID=2781243 RepID=UPI001E2BDBB5|nr:Imm43 family immunity protein [Tenacibaculum finnmarkense]MCD8455092.1 immunity 43 family protein [Tenacibaculum finnmarkense genomovar ulcerans]